MALGRGRSIMLPLGLVGLYTAGLGLDFGLCGLSSNSGEAGEFRDSLLTTMGAGARPVTPCLGVGSCDAAAAGDLKPAVVAISGV